MDESATLPPFLSEESEIRNLEHVGEIDGREEVLKVVID